MEIYLVGGAVRDRLLDLPVKEKDWVVVGSTPEKMLVDGFSPVGKDFPVFLHPKTKEEYALARTERKVAKGYKGFEFYADPTVTLEQDLQRRDLTINAIAEAASGELIDPFDGQQDIKAKLLRHVSPAFQEDPVRILRIARFAAKLPDFSVAEETVRLMEDMVAAGEVDALVAERVWQECEKAMHMPAPWRFFEVLEGVGAANVLWPALMWNEFDSQMFADACSKTDSPLLRFVVAWCTLDLEDARVYSARYRLPNHYSELLHLVIRLLPEYHMAKELTPQELLHVFKSVDLLRRPTRFELWLQASELASGFSAPVSWLQTQANKLMALDEASIVANCEDKGRIAATIEQARIEALS